MPMKLAGRFVISKSFVITSYSIHYTKLYELQNCEFAYEEASENITFGEYNFGEYNFGEYNIITGQFTILRLKITAPSAYFKHFL